MFNRSHLIINYRHFKIIISYGKCKLIVPFVLLFLILSNKKCVTQFQDYIFYFKFFIKKKYIDDKHPA